MNEAPKRPSPISETAFVRIQKGDLITYLLPPSAQPVNPLREWHGRVELVTATMVRVASLDEGYEGETEEVRRTEILSATSGKDEKGGKQR